MANEKKSGPIRIIIVDDHSIVREGLRLILSTDPNLEVVGQAADGREGLDLIKQLAPDVALLDVDMPRMTGIEALRELAAKKSSVKPIVLTASIENRQIVEALQLGARSVIRKQTPPRDLIRCIHTVNAGQIWLGQNAFDDRISALQSLASETPEAAAKFKLTAKETQVIAAVLEGDTNKAIAERLSISEQTVKNHLTNIFNKTGVSNRLELALFAAKHRL
jgi:two-component system nitrate/nitrite response regulator NarL